jgi:hypothetical protein
MPSLLLPLLLWLLPGRVPPAVPAHNFYVSYGQMAVEGGTVLLRIKLFTDDLEHTLQTVSGDRRLRLQPDPHVDKVFLDYFNQHFTLRSGGRTWKATLVTSGEENDMWWYLLRFDTGTTLRRFTLRHAVLFDQFEDQKNIVKVKLFPGEDEQTFYFSTAQPEQQVAF